MRAFKGRGAPAPKLILASVVLLSCILSPLATGAQVNITNDISIASSDTSIRLNWVSVPGAAFYEILRGGTSIHTTDVALDKYPFSYTDTGLTPETAYSYEVHALNSNHAQMDTGTVTASTGKMIAPSIIDAVYNINTGEVTINWINNSAAVAGSIIRYHDTGAAAATIMTAATNSTFSDARLAAGPVSYDAYSNDSAAHVSGSSQTATVRPINPPAVSASVKDGNVVIDTGNYSEIGHFRLETSKWEGTQWGSWCTTAYTASGSQLTEQSNAAGTFRYWLAAKAEDGYSGCSNITGNVVKPGVPSNLTYNLAASDKIVLSWVNNPGNDSTLLVQRRANNGAWMTLASLVSGTASYTDTYSFSSDTTYYYRVTAFENEDNLSASMECSYKPSAPSAPTNLYLVAESPAEISVNWNDNANNELSYKVECSVNSGSYAEVSVSGVDAVKYSATGLTAGNTYKFRARASNYAGDSAYTNEVSLLLPAAVTIPNTLNAKPVSSAQIDLSWTLNASGNYSMQIQRKTGTAGTWTVVANTPPGAKSYSDTGLTPNTQYFYRVRTVLSPNVFSNFYPANDIGTEAFTKLSGIALSGSANSSNQIYLYWSGGASSTEFTIERKLAGGEFISVKKFTTGETSWHDSGVIPNAAYVYRIQGKNSSNESTYSNEVSITNTYLDAPSGLTASIGQDGSVRLSWTDNSIAESGYEVWRYISGTAGSWQLYDTLGSNSVSYTDKNVQNGLQYNYMVRSFTLTNNVYSSFSNDASAGSGMLAPPDSLSYAVVSDSQINLAWKDNSDNESGFKIDRKVGMNGEWITVYTLAANTTSCSITGLSPNTRYYFRIKTYSSSYSTDSLSDEIAVVIGRPEVPADIKLTSVGARKVMITWTDTAGNAKYYKIECKKSGDTYISLAGTCQAGVISFTHSSLQPGTTYYYRVTAVNDSGSTASDFMPVTTPREVTFKDITKHWAKSAIENLAGRGIIQGSNGLFKPDASITRAEFVCLMMRAYGLGSADGGTMTDVKPDKWYYGELMAAKKYGIISGDDNGRFYPDKKISREDMAVIIVKTLKTAGISLKSYNSSVLEDFTDKNLISPYALSSMAALCGEKIMEGSGGKLNPKNNATRAEAAELLSKVIDR